METESVLGWMFVREDRRIAGAVVEAGKTLIADPASNAGNRIAIRPLDALRHATGPIVCRVETTATPSGRSVKVLWIADASEVLHAFACDVAEQAMNDAGETDERCRNAIAVKRRWIIGEATDEELKAAAGAAAWAAAEAAAAATASARAAREAKTRTAEWAATEATWAAESTRLNDDLEARLMTLAPRQEESNI